MHKTQHDQLSKIINRLVRVSCDRADRIEMITTVLEDF